MSFMEQFRKSVGGLLGSAALDNELPAVFEIDDGVLLKYNGIAAEVAIPDEVTVIGEAAFAKNTKVKRVTMGSAVTVIGNIAFDGCTALESIVLPDSVVKIGTLTFRGCRALKSIDIPEGVSEIGIGAFENCESLVSAALPKNVMTAEHAIFRNCRALTHIRLGSGLKKIESSAFDGCKSLTGLVIPEGVIGIGLGAFQDCVSLTDIVIPDGVTFIQKNLFHRCTGLRSVVLPEEITSIDEAAFKGCTSLDNVVLHDNIDKINSMVFCDCKSLKHIVIPDSVYSIGHAAFKGCKSLAEPHLPDSVMKIADEAFDGCPCCDKVSVFTPVMLSDAVYGDFTFDADDWGITIKGYSGSESDLVIPAEIDGIPVTGIGKNAFENNKHLVSVQLPDSIFRIGSAAFCDCRSLRHINIPHRVTRLDRSTFMNCVSLEEINIPHRIKLIAYAAFQNCTALKSIYLPKRVMDVSNMSFIFCSSLQEIRVQQGNRSFCDIDGVLFNKDGTEIEAYPAGRVDEEYRLPDSVTELRHDVFLGVQKLKRLVLHEKVKYFYMMNFKVGEELDEIVLLGDTQLNTLRSCENGFRVFSARHSAGEWKDGVISYMVARGFVKGSYCGMKFEPDVEEANRQFIAVNKKEFFRNELFDEYILRYMIDEDVILLQDIGDLLDMCRSNAELTALLLEYRKRRFPEVDNGSADDMYSID